MGLNLLYHLINDLETFLVQDLAGGFVAPKLLLKLDTVNALLEHHSPDLFAFLRKPSSFRNRTIFYNTLAKLLFMEDGAIKFMAFVASMQQVGGALVLVTLDTSGCSR